MIAVWFAFLCVGAGAIAEDEEHECDALLPEDKLEELFEADYIPDEELLKEICPPVVSFMECFETEEVQKTDSKGDRQYFFNIKHLILDLCEEDSRLQKAYLASADCFRNGIGKLLLCKEMSEGIYLYYRKFIDVDGDGATEVDDEEDDSVTTHERECMTTAYTLACTSNQMEKECGAVAHETLLELSQRADILRNVCNAEEKLKLKSDFLEFLIHEEHSDLDIIRSYLERKKK